MTVQRLLATTAVLSLLLGSVPVTFDSVDGTLSWQVALAKKGGNGKGGGKKGRGGEDGQSAEVSGDSLGKGHGTPGQMDGHGGQVPGGHGEKDGHSHGLGHEKGHGGQVPGGHDPDTGHTHGLGEIEDTSGVDVGENQEDGRDSNDGTAGSESDMGDVVESAAAELESPDSN